ncbi:MAG TPA: PAS domain S-box protein, partial [bacterium]|nr:PAS domain S-box protein [bacterium]
MGRFDSRFLPLERAHGRVVSLVVFAVLSGLLVVPSDVPHQIAGTAPPAAQHLHAFDAKTVSVANEARRHVFLVADVERDVSSAGADRVRVRYVAGALLLAAAIFALSRHFSTGAVFGPLAWLVRLAEQIRAGDLATRGGRQSGPMERGHSGRARDQPAQILTEREERTAQATHALRGSEEQMRKIFDEGPVGMSLLDTDSRFVRVNRAFAEMLGQSIDGLHGKSLADVTHPLDRDLDRTLLSQLLAGAIPRYQIEKRYMTKDGRAIWGQLTAAVIHGDSGYPSFRIAAVEDITARKATENKLNRTAARLRALSRRVVDLQETERREISRELHDEVGQALTGLKLLLEMATRQPKGAGDRLQEALSIVGRLIIQVRTLTLDLRPPMLDDLGLLAALAWYVDRFSAQSGLQVQFQHYGIEQPLPPPLATAAYRIVQEGLTNVARHARAGRVDVHLVIEQGILAIRIADNGEGFDVGATLATGTASGLAGMRERAEFLDGT